MLWTIKNTLITSSFNLQIQNSKTVSFESTCFVSINKLFRFNSPGEFQKLQVYFQYISPTDVQKLGQCELIVIDEAAAIPLPLVKELISGPYISFLASTINGYEGTGRSLSLKLLQQLRQQSAGGEAKEGKSASSKGRTLHEMHMEESIRYKPGDKVSR